ncbi:BTB/POZ and MATH domain-containing protein 2 [Rhynchospora pubera]|uniref:BTB/POZ and MATH domain-containing protein 2 n=1 Tax=Rhynchospora pubera TaxID=906938 RepID=A0AAV8ED32_9POAL|nr:BTB/POZ and MATH domain-containing protein 2 [Rhynchospora pubera]
MEVACGTYQFKAEYSKLKDVPKGDCIVSLIFKVNGHKCVILYFPHDNKHRKDPMQMTFVMLCKSEDVTGGLALASPLCLRHCMEQSEFEAYFIRDVCFTLVCSVTIISESYKEVPKRFVGGILPFGINDHLSQLLERKETADMSFEVDGEILTAHKISTCCSIAGVQSRAFWADSERKMEFITVKDVNPIIFKAMLHFIYTDSILSQWLHGLNIYL